MRSCLVASALLILLMVFVQHLSPSHRAVFPAGLSPPYSDLCVLPKHCFHVWMFCEMRLAAVAIEIEMLGATEPLLAREILGGSQLPVTFGRFCSNYITVLLMFTLPNSG